MTYDITSQTNDRVKWLVRLKDRRQRDADGVFVVEGQRLYDRAVAAGLLPTVTFASDREEVGLVGEVVTVEPTVLDKTSYRSRSQGIIGVFPQLDTGLDQIEPPSSPLILVVENIEKPGNLGAMLRTASAAGADAVVAVGTGVDPFNPNAVRASTGALFTLPLAVSTWDETGPWLTEKGVRIVAGSPSGTESLWATDLSGAVALVVGAEDVGLSDRAVEVADDLVIIPQATTDIDSLNTSVAAGLLLFEAVRQRTSTP